MRFRTDPFGTLLHKSDYTANGVPVINPMHIVDGSVVPTGTMTVTEPAAASLSDFRIRENDILVGRRGDMGRCAVIGKHEEGWLCGTGSMIVRCGELLYPPFLQRILSSPQAVAAIVNSSVGTTMVNLNNGTLSALKTQLPPLIEQRAIAMALSDVDRLLCALERLIAKKRDLKQAAMQQLLTGQTRLPGFDSVNARFKPLDLGPIPAEWEESTIGALEPFVTSGSRGWARFYADRGELFVRITNMSRTLVYLDLTDSQYVRLPSKGHEGGRAQLEVGDLLISVTADIGLVSYVDNNVPLPAYINQHIALVRVDRSKVDRLFVAYLLAHTPSQRRFRAITDQGAKAGINLTTVRQIPLVLPPRIAEQTAIAAVISDMDAELAALEQRRDKTRALKQAMMQELLTGKTRLV